MGKMGKNRIFKSALDAYAACGGLRQRRSRFKDYAYGRQWEDLVVDPESGKTMTEGELVRITTGRDPVSTNLIRQMIKTIVGRFRDKREKESVDPRLESVYRFNSLDELDSRAMEEFLISGCVVQRVVRECRTDGEISTYIDNVSPNDFFINAIKDPRGRDIQLVGMVHDMALPELLDRFGGGDELKREELTRIFTSEFINDNLSGGLFDAGVRDSAEIFLTSPTGRCRVIEVWTLESAGILRVHDMDSGSYFEMPESRRLAGVKGYGEKSGRLLVKRASESRWRCRWFAPDGSVVGERVAPRGLPHPFIVKLYPLIDGEVHPFVEDIIDQQRQINRLITLTDHIMSVSAKGVLLFPTRCKVESLSWNEMRSRWGKCGGIIPYYATPGYPGPEQITSKGLDAGASSLLDTQLRMLREISGVGDILSGGNGTSGVGVDSYSRQIENESVALNDLFATFRDFIERRDQLARQLEGIIGSTRGGV